MLHIFYTMQLYHRTSPQTFLLVTELKMPANSKGCSCTSTNTSPYILHTKPQNEPGKICTSLDNHQYTVWPSLIRGNLWCIRDQNQWPHLFRMALVLEVPGFPAMPADWPRPYFCTCVCTTGSVTCGEEETNMNGRRGSQGLGNQTQRNGPP